MARIKIGNSDRFEEDLHDGFGSYLTIKDVIFESNDKQYVLLFESEAHGKVLVLDESIQLTEREEATYHEAITHVPLFSHKNPVNVLIIGGGDGGVAAHVLMHPSVKYVKQVEIDSTVVEISKKYLQSVHKGAFNDPRHHLVIGDGAKFVEETDERFDVVIVDCSDPDPDDSVNNVLYSKEFYKNVARVLNSEGIVVTQNGMPNLQTDELVTSIAYLRDIFTYATTYLVDSPMYTGGNIAIGFATNNLDSIDTPLEVIKEGYTESKIETDYYTPELHKAMFVLPKKILKLLDGKNYY